MSDELCYQSEDEYLQSFHPYDHFEVDGIPTSDHAQTYGLMFELKSDMFYSIEWKGARWPEPYFGDDLDED